MKKINKIIVLCIALLMMPLIVKADMGAPEITSYYVTISNKEGAQIYDYEGNKEELKLDYDKKIEITIETTINNEEYVGYYKDDDTHYLKTSDVSLLSNVDFSKFYKLTKDEYIYVYKSGAELYKGPSKNYGKVKDGSIPIGKKLKVQYKDEMWSYVEYDGKKGWIYSYSYSDFSPYENLTSSVCDYINSSLIMVKDQIKLYNSVENDSKYELISIPQNTIINYNKILYNQPHSSMIYIEYNDYKGWVKNDTDETSVIALDDYYRENEFKFIALKDIELYDSPITKKIISTIKGNTKVEQSNKFVYYYDEYEGENYYYVEVEGLKGWILADNIAEFENRKILTVNDLELKDTYEGTTTIGKISKLKEIKGYYVYDDYNSTPNKRYYYFEEKNNSGWIINKGDIANYTSDCTQKLVLKGNTVLAVSAEDNSEIRLPEYSIIDELYTYSAYNNNNDIESRSYIRYNNKYYWITTTNYILASRYENASYKLKSDYIKESLHVYNDISLTKEVFDITDNEKFDELFYYYVPNKGQILYINYKGQKGWVKFDSEKLEKVNVENNHCLLTDLDSNNKEIKQIQRVDKVSKSLNIKTIIIGIIIAVILSLSSIMTILIINKKKEDTNK